jgi:hypothetical protein
MSKRKILASVVTTVIAAAVIAGFFSVGSPGNERLRRFDDQRSQDLEMLRVSGIDEYVRRTGSLPASLDDVQKTVAIASPDSFMDPETGEPFEYRRTGDTSFSLCTTFDLASAPNQENPYLDPVWTHPAGRVCFDFEVRSTGPTIKSSVPIPAAGAQLLK